MSDIYLIQEPCINILVHRGPCGRNRLTFAASNPCWYCSVRNLPGYVLRTYSYLTIFCHFEYIHGYCRSLIRRKVTGSSIFPKHVILCTTSATRIFYIILEYVKVKDGRSVRSISWNKQAIRQRSTSASRHRRSRPPQFAPLSMKLEA
jgi:hypothetical protein